MPQLPYNVLFLCTGNSARSIIAEAITNREGMGKFTGYSAGSMPKGVVNPHTLDLLRKLNYDVSGLRSKAALTKRTVPTDVPGPSQPNGLFERFAVMIAK